MLNEHGGGQFAVGSLSMALQERWIPIFAALSLHMPRGQAETQGQCRVLLWGPFTCSLSLVLAS